MKYVSYLSFRLLVFLFSLLPFSLIYVLANGLAWLFDKVLGYRRNVIEKNIEIAFPEKSPGEREAILKQFYQNLADITLESIKGLSISQEELTKRFRVINPSILDDHYRQNQSILLIGGHFGNWEWGAMSVNIFFQHTVLGIFKPLKNEYINKYVTDLRGQWDIVLVPVKETRNYVEAYVDQASIIAIVADQTPSNLITTIWVDFLGKVSAFPPGPELIARAYNYPVFCYAIRRRARGYYEMELEPLVSAPNTLPEHELTHLFAKKIEQQIQEMPDNWLWSHKRWKHQKEPNAPSVYQ